MPSVKPRDPNKKPGLHIAIANPSHHRKDLIKWRSSTTASAILNPSGWVTRHTVSAVSGYIPVCTKWVKWPDWTKLAKVAGVESKSAMPQILDRGRHAADQAGVLRSRPLPVLLATLSVRVDPSAERMAIDSSLEAGAKLIVANMLVLPPYPLTFMLAPEYATLPHEEDLDAVVRRPRARRRSASQPSCCGSRAVDPSGPCWS